MSLLLIVHVLISLIGIASGLVAIAGFLTGNRFRSWNLVFLVATTATSLTGFLFPITRVTPGIVVGAISLGVLGLAFVALSKRAAKTYIVAAVIAEFLNVLVLITQLFEKVPLLHRHAPTGTEPLVAIVQGLAFIVFTVLAVSAVKRSAWSLA